MKGSNVLNSKKIRIGLLILSVLGLTYAVTRLLFFDSDPLTPFLHDFFHNWLVLYTRISAYQIKLLDLPYEIRDTELIFHDQVYELSPKILARKWFFGLLILIWIFPVKLRTKIKGSLILIFFHMLFVTTGILLLASRNSFYYVTNNSAYHVARTPLVFFFTIFLSFWIIMFRDKLYPALKRFNVNTGFIEQKLPEIFIIMYLYAFVNNFVLGWYDYVGWIQFLFESSASILEIFGYKARVFMTYLIGANGSIYMEKSCLGFGTMALFAAVVYLTSENTRGWWIYVIAGILFLNIVNILRFVFLFIHIQKNHGYALAMDVHDMYNLIIYAVVFILWVIWFELFALKNQDPDQVLILNNSNKSEDEESSS